jgi:hypothetical protein
MFETNRFTEQSLSVAYERVVPLSRRWTTIPKRKEESRKWKMARRAGGAL